MQTLLQFITYVSEFFWPITRINMTLVFLLDWYSTCSNFLLFLCLEFVHQVHWLSCWQAPDAIFFGSGPKHLRVQPFSPPEMAFTLPLVGLLYESCSAAQTQEWSTSNTTHIMGKQHTERPGYMAEQLKIKFYSPCGIITATHLILWYHVKLTSLVASFSIRCEILVSLTRFQPTQSFKYHETYFITSIPIYRFSHLYSHFLRITFVEPLFYARWSHSRNKQLYIHISFMFHFRDFRSIPDGLIARESRLLPQVLWEDDSSFLSQGFFNCLCVLVLIKLLALFSELWKVKQFR